MEGYIFRCTLRASAECQLQGQSDGSNECPAFTHLCGAGELQPRGAEAEKAVKLRQITGAGLRLRSSHTGHDAASISLPLNMRVTNTCLSKCPPQQAANAGDVPEGEKLVACE